MPQTPLIYPQPDLTPQGTALMVDEVARLVGAPDDPELRTAALIALDRAADRMNMAGLYLYRRKQAAYGGILDGSTTVDLPSDWAWPIGQIEILGSDGSLVRVSDWVEWDTYRREAIDPTSVGVPLWFTILSEFDAKAYFYPGWDSTQTTSLNLTYCARIQHPSEASDDQLYFTGETRECLISGGQFLIMQHRYAGQPGVWAPYKGDFDRNIKLCRASAARQLAGAKRQIQVDTTGRPALGQTLRTGVYVRIG